MQICIWVLFCLPLLASGSPSVFVSSEGDMTITGSNSSDGILSFAVCETPVQTLSCRFPRDDDSASGSKGVTMAELKIPQGSIIQTSIQEYGAFNKEQENLFEYEFSFSKHDNLSGRYMLDGTTHASPRAPAITLLDIQDGRQTSLSCEQSDDTYECDVWLPATSNGWCIWECDATINRQIIPELEDSRADGCFYGCWSQCRECDMDDFSSWENIGTGFCRYLQNNKEFLYNPGDMSLQQCKDLCAAERGDACTAISHASGACNMYSGGPYTYADDVACPACTCYIFHVCEIHEVEGGNTLGKATAALLCGYPMDVQLLESFDNECAIFTITLIDLYRRAGLELEDYATHVDGVFNVTLNNLPPDLTQAIARDRLNTEYILQAALDLYHLMGTDVETLEDAQNEQHWAVCPVDENAEPQVVDVENIVHVAPNNQVGLNFVGEDYLNGYGEAQLLQAHNALLDEGYVFIGFHGTTPAFGDAIVRAGIQAQNQAFDDVLFNGFYTAPNVVVANGYAQVQTQVGQWTIFAAGVLLRIYMPARHRDSFFVFCTPGNDPGFANTTRAFLELHNIVANGTQTDDRTERIYAITAPQAEGDLNETWSSWNLAPQFVAIPSLIPASDPNGRTMETDDDLTWTQTERNISDPFKPNDAPPDPTHRHDELRKEGRTSPNGDYDDEFAINYSTQNSAHVFYSYDCAVLMPGLLVLVHL